ncbi:MAG: L-rhamnose isomerase, partial [Bacteroidetes bacterium]|nr:L-rhamnose isomerase [Bacteroidota bacterium]
MRTSELIKQAYDLAKAQYADLGVDTEEAIRKMKAVNISLHCWQTDDVGGFETPDAALSGGGIQATGNFPGKARNISEVKSDLEKVMSLLPGRQRLNLHAIYGDFQGEKVDRNQIEVKHFQSWIDWCETQEIGMDFNASCFSHTRAADGYTLSSKNEENRQFWVEHV